MAQFNGFVCDECGEVISAKDRTRKTVKLDGPEVRGEYTQDLCREHARDAVPEDVELKPLRRRRTQPEPPVEDDCDTPGTPTQTVG